MSLELLLADSDNLRKQLACVKNQLTVLQDTVKFYAKQRQLIQATVKQLNSVLDNYTEKLHMQELTVHYSKTLRIDETTFKNMIQDVCLVKEQANQLNRILEVSVNDSPKELEDIVEKLEFNFDVSDSTVPLLHMDTNGPSSDNAIPVYATQTAQKYSQIMTTQPQSNLVPPANKFRKQISWDPNTSQSTQSPFHTIEDDESDEDDVFPDSNNSGSSRSLEDGILTSASMGSISLRTMQLLKKRIDDKPPSWYNNVRCCSFAECTLIVHLIYLHAIAIISISGVAFLVVGISLEMKNIMVSGTILVIGSYGLLLNHCFYRGLTPAKPTPNKMRVKAGNQYVDLNASVNETIDVDLTHPERDNDIWQDHGTTRSQQGYLS